MTEKPWIIVGILAVSVAIGVLLLRGAHDRRNARGPRAQEGVSAEEDIRVEPPKPQGPRGSIRVVRRQKTTDDAGASDDSGDVYRIPRWPGDSGWAGGINSRGTRVGIDAEGQPEQPADWSTQAGLGRGRDPKPVQRAPDPVDPSRQLENDRKDAPSEDPDLILSLPLDGRVAVKGDVQVFIEENLKIDEANGTVEFPSDSMLGIANAGHIRSEAGTISMEIVPRWDGSDGGAASFIQVRTPEMWQGAISLARVGSYMLFQFWDADGVDHVVVTNIGTWKAGEPHTVAATWGEALMSMYIDGEIRDQAPYSGDPAFSPDWPLFVGSNPENGLPGANATLKDLRIYSRALTGEEVAAGGSGS